MKRERLLLLGCRLLSRCLIVAANKMTDEELIAIINETNPK